jgi:methyl-galactoside transport system ATP-binding protein
MRQSKVILEMKHISKQFPGVKALDDVTLTVRAGTVHAIMGENGAGKSTLMKCAFGIYHPDSGEIFVDGSKMHFEDTRDAIDQGISMIHQELQVVRSRNVMENVWLGRIPYKKVLGVKWVDRKTMYENTVRLFERLGIEIDPGVVLSQLSVSYCQLIEIARAVSWTPRSSSRMNRLRAFGNGAAPVFKIIGSLRSSASDPIYSHKIEEILQISDELHHARRHDVGWWLTGE